MTRTGDREVGVVSGRLPDNPGELACMLTVIFTFTKQSVMDIDIYAHFDQNNTSKICKQSLGLSAFLSFLLTARNKCISGKQGKDKYSFLEKISFNVPL